MHREVKKPSVFMEKHTFTKYFNKDKLISFRYLKILEKRYILVISTYSG